ncbi:deoxyribodipyrimidine photo-lyase [Alistipes sp. ZOR0009]|uniref:deoxyribodipyrimidine photo-lyase n=1 Tax=Alistipes sp. ZOR0009 TaxID=1339253 RepID=UPI0006464364|nr:deoxyribodipyrimidine photo-lyase [Alistipes sp. ZOR0009]
MVDKRRIFVHKAAAKVDGCIIYRMSRDQRTADNWALIYAQQIAKEQDLPFAVVFTLTPTYPLANIRHYDFMLKGLMEIEHTLNELNIPFYILLDASPSNALQNFIQDNNVSIVISDFDPLKIKQQWIKEINEMDGITHFEVDAHNIVPCRVASQKVEFGAYTLRPKIKKMLDGMLTDFPKLEKQDKCWPNGLHPIAWDKIYQQLSVDRLVTPIGWLTPGESAATRLLSDFINSKLIGYNEKRNNPTLKWQSNLSPYLHFGQISAQRIALEVIKRHASSPDTEAFLEELIVRRELSDNFCFYNPSYDTPAGFPEWAQKDAELHRLDEREYLYTRNQLENYQTHDPLWNAAQKEMVVHGKMHGYMRMYWAKKLLEWTPSAEEAMQTAIYLNDKYSLDGRDPNGYAGIAWSIGGVHDRAWFPRPIFGKIRYMNYNGCKSKFDVNAYIHAIK